MSNILRGDCGCLSRANTGVRHSSNGSARVTPAPRRKARRERHGEGIEIDGTFMSLPPSWLTNEDVALHEREQQVSHAVAIGGTGFK